MSAAASESFRFNVGNLAPAKRLGVWTDTLCDRYYPLDLSSPASDFLKADLITFDLPGLRFGVIDADPMQVDRRRKHLCRKSSDYYFIPIPQCGPLTLRQAGREAQLVAGDFSLITTAEAYQYLQGTYNRHLTLRIEGTLARERIPLIDDLVALPCRSEAPLVRIFADLVRSVVDQRGRLDPASAEALVPQVLDLLALALTAPVQALESTESAVRLAHLRRIMRAIEAHLDDLHLGPASLSAELGLSERYIQKMLAERGETLTGLIRARRIAAAQRRLTDPTRASASIAAIGFSVGFADPAHFSRVFRAATGLSPSAYRQKALPRA